MTREEAIKQLSDAEHCLAGHGDLWDVDMEAFDMAIKALKQNSILDKIKAEIEQIEINGHIRDVECFRAGVNVALDVIDKYKAESEEV
jgi:Zn finger protein HypA/HybF involved in hydrogenase expression